MPSISVTNPELITSINLGDATPKLGGIVNLQNFKVIKSFFGDQQDLSGFQNYSTNTTFTTVHLQNNKLTGNVPDLSSSPNCGIVFFNNNNLDGTLPTTLPAGIMIFRAGNNALHKSDTHLIPDLSTYTNLAEFNIKSQSADYGTTNGGTGWFGPGKLANETIEGAIPESMRIFNYNQGNLSQAHKRILLTQFYDTFKDKPTNWAKTTQINGINYATPQLRVKNTRGTGFTDLVGIHGSVLKSTATAKLADVGFTVEGF
jgi:hypothetical protein